MWKKKIFICVFVLLTGTVLYFYLSKNRAPSYFTEQIIPEFIWNVGNTKAFYYTGVDRKIGFNFALDQPWPYSEVSFADWDLNIPSRLYLVNPKGVFSYDFATHMQVRLLEKENILSILPLDTHLITLTDKELISINLSTHTITELLTIDLPEIPGHSPPLALTKLSASTFMLEIPDQFFMLTGEKKYYLGNAEGVHLHKVEEFAIN